MIEDELTLHSERRAPSAAAWAFLLLTLPHTRMELAHGCFTASPLVTANFYSDEKKDNKPPRGRPRKYAS